MSTSFDQQFFPSANVRGWQQTLSPDITPAEVASILQGAFRDGRLDQQAELFQLMEDSWYRLRKNALQLSGAVARLPITVNAYHDRGEDPTPEDEMNADLVESALWSCKPRQGTLEIGIEGLVKTLFSAYLRGHSVVEILWHVNSEGIVAPRAFLPVPATHYAYTWQNDAEDKLLFSPKGSNSIGDLQEFPENKFLIARFNYSGDHPTRAANLRALARYWIAQHFGLRWFMRFANVFGIPWRTVETDGSQEAQSAAIAALQTLGAEGFGVFPEGTKLEIHSATGGSQSIHESLINMADKAADLLILGQTLTSDVSDSGSRALGDVHEGVLKEHVQGAADFVFQTITEQLIPAIIRLNYGESSDRVPWISASVPKQKDHTATAERILKAQQAGIPVPKQWAHEELQIPIPAESEDILDPKKPEFDPFGIEAEKLEGQKSLGKPQLRQRTRQVWRKN